MASGQALANIISSMSPGADQQPIQDYSGVGQWAQQRGGGVLNALSQLAGQLGQLQQAGQQQQSEQAWQNAIKTYMEKNNLAPGTVPDKIDTTGMPIPFNMTQNPKDAPGNNAITQSGLTPQQMQKQTMTPGENESMIANTLNGLNPNQMLTLAQLNKGTTMKGGGTGNPLLDKAKEIRDYMNSFDFMQSDLDTQNQWRTAYSTIMKSAGALPNSNPQKDASNGIKSVLDKKK